MFIFIDNKYFSKIKKIKKIIYKKSVKLINN